jgi:hypothetical protein
LRSAGKGPPVRTRREYKARCGEHNNKSAHLFPR